MHVTRLKTVAGAVIVMVGLVLSAYAKPACKKQTIEQLVAAVAQGWEEKGLAKLDPDKPYAGVVRISIEHSLADDNDPGRFQVRRFASFALFEKWLKKREIDSMPGRSAMPLVKCAKGACTYNFDGGIVHNTLYLQKITYGVRGGCPYIKTIYLLDGD